MFEVGDRVVCVDDRPYGCGTYFPLGKGKKFIVLQAWGGHQPIASGVVAHESGAISIGVISTEVQADAWSSFRFRKLRDISQSLRELKELAINCPALVEP